MKRVPEADIPGQRVPRDVDMKDVYKQAQDPGSASMGYIPANRTPGKSGPGGDARQAAFRTALGEVSAATPETLKAVLTQVNRRVD